MRTAEGSAERTVLVVDDDDDNRITISRELQKDFRVLQADAFATAMTFVESAALVAVVSDLHMGAGSSGLDLLREVRKQLPSCVRILVSGAPVVHFSRDVVDRHVAKPWSPGTIRLAIMQAIAGTGEAR